MICENICCVGIAPALLCLFICLFAYIVRLFVWRSKVCWDSGRIFAALALLPHCSGRNFPNLSYDPSARLAAFYFPLNQRFRVSYLPTSYYSIKNVLVQDKAQSKVVAQVFVHLVLLRDDISLARRELTFQFPPIKKHDHLVKMQLRASFKIPSR